MILTVFWIYPDFKTPLSETIAGYFRGSSQIKGRRGIWDVHEQHQNGIYSYRCKTAFGTWEGNEWNVDHFICVLSTQSRESAQGVFRERIHLTLYSGQSQMAPFQYEGEKVISYTSKGCLVFCEEKPGTRPQPQRPNLLNNRFYSDHVRTPFSSPSDVQQNEQSSCHRA